MVQHLFCSIIRKELVMSGMLRFVLTVVVALVVYDLLVKPFTSKISIF